MKSGALVLGIIVSVLLLAAAGVLSTMAGGSSGQQHRASIELVRQIQQLSSTWSVEVARVRADPLADFDALAAFIPRMARLKERLATTSGGIPDLPDRLASDVRVYLSAVDAKEERIERFKTGYAVVRNSARYLPLAAANVVRRAREMNDAPLAQRIAALAQDMQLFVATPTGADQERLIGSLEHLREASVEYPPSVANALANLLAHAEVLLARQGPTEELFEKATASEIAGLADRLAGALAFELGRQKTAATYYERGVLAVVAALALFWILLAVQQRARGGADREAAAPAAARIRAEPVIADHEPLRSPVPRDELAGHPPATAGGPAAAPPAGLGAEAALMYRFLSRQVGCNITAAAERMTARLDSMCQVHGKVQQALQSGDLLPEPLDGTDLDEELEAGAATAAQMRREVNGIADLAGRLASFSGLTNGDAERTMVDVNACIDEVVAATGAEQAAVISKRLDDVPEIFASKTELRALLAQVLENSVRAVQGLEGRRGTIKIDTAPRNDEIVITVIDNGSGIAPDRRMRIFRPFYTSRNGAMGLGLTLAGHLVKKYEGKIKVNSLPGQGTVTRITLPTGTPGP